jgi:hypothetical protein
VIVEDLPDGNAWRPACEGTTGVQTRFEFVARGGERVVVSGGGSSVPERWAGPDQGTYAYFGTLAPIETANVRAVIDLGLPKWLKARIDDLLPRVFAYYAKRTGYPVNTRHGRGPRARLGLSGRAQRRDGWHQPATDGRKT